MCMDVHYDHSILRVFTKVYYVCIQYYSTADVDDDKACDGKDGTAHEQGTLVV